MYATVAQKFLLPFHDRVIKRRNTWRYRRFLEGSQRWSRQELLDFQWGEFKKLLTHAFEQVPYWQEVSRQSGITQHDIQSPEDLRRLPIIERRDIRANKQQMIARNYLGKTWTKRTGGSTGEPLELDYTPDSYDWRVAISKRGYGWAGCEDGARQVWIWGVPIGDRPILRDVKEKLHQRVLGQLVFNSFAFDEGTMEKCLRTINRFRPQTIVGYTNPLHNFAQFVMQRGGLTFRPSAIISAAETLFPYQRRDIERAFGARVFNTYGSREFMLIAAECGHDAGLHLSVENLFVEVVRDDGTPTQPGEMGHVLVTDLHNYGMPFIRYRIGDMAVSSAHVCSCGRGMPMLQEVVGRTLDIIRTRDGRCVPGEFFPHLMKEFRGVKQVQVVQTDLDHLTVNIVKDDAIFTPADYEFLKREIDKVFRTSIGINIQFLPQLSLTPTGKFRVTVSNVLPQRAETT